MKKNIELIILRQLLSMNMLMIVILQESAITTAIMAMVIVLALRFLICCVVNIKLFGCILKVIAKIKQML